MAIFHFKFESPPLTPAQPSSLSRQARVLTSYEAKAGSPRRCAAEAGLMPKFAVEAWLGKARQRQAQAKAGGLPTRPQKTLKELVAEAVNKVTPTPN